MVGASCSGAKCFGGDMLGAKCWGRIVGGEMLGAKNPRTILNGLSNRVSFLMSTIIQ